MEKERKGLEDLKELKDNSFLPPIRKDFEMEILSEEELVERSKVADERKETVQTYAEQEIKIRTALQFYKSKVPNWDFLSRTDPVREEIERLQKRLEELVNIDGDLGESIEFAKLVKEVQLTDEFFPAVKMMERLEKQEKRIWIPTPEETKKAQEENEGKWPEGTLFFNRKVYFQKLETAGARILNKRVREMTHRVNTSKINRMAASGSHNLTGIRREVLGKYYLFSLRHKEEKNGRVFVRAESHTLVKIFDKNKGQRDARPYLILEVEDTFMGTDWMLENRKSLSFPLFWFLRGRVIIAKEKRRPPEDEENHINNVIRVLNGILYGCEKEQKKIESAKTPEPAPAEALSISAKFDRTVIAESGDVKVFVKPKKTSSEPIDKPTA